MNALRCLGLALLVGCGSSASVESTGTDGSGDDGSSGDICEEFLPAPSAPVMLRVRNDRAEAIFVDNVGCSPGLRITSGGERVAWRFPDCNLAPCGGVLSGECGIACGDCAPGILRINPGGTFEQLWEGGVFVDSEVPQMCAAEGCELACHQELPIPEATYELASDIFLSCPLDDPAQCDCPGGEQDSCAIFVETPVSGTSTPASVEFSYPAETTAEIVIAP